LSDIELPAGFGPVGSLHQAIIRLDIPSCGNATIFAHEAVRYIRLSEGCPREKLAKLHRTYENQVKRRARKHRVAFYRQRLAETIERLKQSPNVDLPEAHNCQTGVLWLGPHPWNQPRRKATADERPPWIIQAGKRLTKFPYSLLFSFLRLVKEPKPGDAMDDYVPPHEVLEWCSKYGLPDTEEFHRDERYGCLEVGRFQWETVILYLLFHLWKAVIDWQQFKKVSAPSDPVLAEQYREAIHRYADLLLRLRYAPDSPSVLAAAIDRERFLKRQLDHGKRTYLDHQSQRTIDLQKEYRDAQAAVEKFALASIDEVIQARMRRDMVPSVEGSQIVSVARSVFAGCYLQLKCLILKPLGEAARHLKTCQACGNLFWAPHGHMNFVSCTPGGQSGPRNTGNHPRISRVARRGNFDEDGQDSHSTRAIRRGAGSCCSLGLTGSTMAHSTRRCVGRFSKAAPSSSARTQLTERVSMRIIRTASPRFFVQTRLCCSKRGR
jgi:hypothetical protein